MTTISILVASNGQNLKLAQQIADAFSQKEAKTTLIDLVDLDLPLYSPVSESAGLPSQLMPAVETVTASDAVVVVAPEYNGSLPPTLNNFIAWVSRSSDDWRAAFNAKPALIASFSGGGGLHVLAAMRAQLAYLGMTVLGRQLQVNFKKALNDESLDTVTSQLLDLV